MIDQLRKLAFYPVFVAVTALAGFSAATAAEPAVQSILSDCKIRGGLVVQVGCSDGKLVASLGALGGSESYLVQGLDRDPKNVETARQVIRGSGSYGRVSVDRWSGTRLPYVDNLVNLVIVEDAAAIDRDELLRVLAPNGVALVRSGDEWTKTVKPWPADIDQWTHYLHDAGNNAVADDRVVGPPKHYQWIGTPDYLRHHDHMSGLSAMVSARGRLFYIIDLGPRWSVQMPPQWTLVARDAFNGVVLWQRPIDKWHPHLWPLKRGPAQLMRRLVAEDDQVYATLGVGEPVTTVDAATGRTIRALPGTEGAEEIIVANGVVYVLVNPDLDAYRAIPKDSVEAIRSAGRDWNWDERPRRIVAVDAATGGLRWTHESRVAPGTLAAAGGRVHFHDGDRVICLAASDGKPAWASKPIARWSPMHVLFNPTLVVYRDVVLFAGGEKLDPQRGGNDTMTALSADDGRVLWTAPHPPSGYASAEDLFVADGLVWCGVTSSPRDSGVFTGRDPHTGEVKVEFPPDDWRHMPHHRCYRAKATCNYILTSRTGIEFVDFHAKHWTAHHWVRGSCNYGILPANGLLYAPPHSCACYLLAKLNGFNALAPARKSRVESRESRVESRESRENERLECGPAYSHSASPPSRPSTLDPQSSSGSRLSTLNSSLSTEWPTYRHDPLRSGSTTTAVPADIKQVWQSEVGGRLSALTLADGRLFVASIDAHMVHAIDANTGKTLWSYTAGGRVDSPPTIWQGRVLFGSADGCVYCLRAADGALVWRFRAAPFDERLTAAGQVESVWPVHGSVLVWEGIVYCVAGRAMWLDGGLRLLRIDATSGRKLSETLLDDTDPRSGENLQTDLRWPNLPVALPDILSCDGRYVYMRSQPFDLEGNRTEVITPRDYTDQRGDTAHLFSATGFLDDSFWHRSYWMWGKSFISGAGGWYLAGYQAPAGNILAVDGSKVYGFGYAPLRFTGTPKLYHVFACDREPEIVADPKVAPRTRGASVFGQVVPSRLEYDWSQSAPLIGKALVVAGDNLFLAGPPALVDETEVYLDYGNAAVQAKMAEHVAAFEGRKGGLLVAVSKADGQQSAAWRLESPPVFDGMIAAGGRLYLATMNGKIVCLGSGERTPLPAAPDAKLGPLPIAPGSAAVVPTKSHPDFQQLVAIQVGTSDLGYRMRTAPGGVGLALKKLPSPIAKRAVFSAKVRPTPGALSPDKPGNGFLVFGDGPGDEHLIKCGFRVSGKVLMVVQGPLAGSRGKSKKVDVKADEVAELRATVDLESQTITASMLGETLEVPLERPIDSVTWAGYGIASVTTDFGPMEIAGD